MHSNSGRILLDLQEVVDYLSILGEVRTTKLLRDLEEITHDEADKKILEALNRFFQN